MLRSPTEFRAALDAVPTDQRDGWCDQVLGLHGVTDDGPTLPRGGVPYLPCAVDVLLRAATLAEITADDVFVDVGAGVGRAACVVHLLTGARAIGLEIQDHLVAIARARAQALPCPRVTFVHGDAAETIATAGADASVFFFYCPFGGERLRRVLGVLEGFASTRPIRVCCVDLPLPACPWLELVQTDGDLVVYRAQPPSLRSNHSAPPR